MTLTEKNSRRIAEHDRTAQEPLKPYVRPTLVKSTISPTYCSRSGATRASAFPIRRTDASAAKRRSSDTTGGCLRGRLPGGVRAGRHRLPAGSRDGGAQPAPGTLLGKKRGRCFRQREPQLQPAAVRSQSPRVPGESLPQAVGHHAIAPGALVDTRPDQARAVQRPGPSRPWSLEDLMQSGPSRPGRPIAALKRRWRKSSWGQP
jgi:hypothetical protein